MKKVSVRCWEVENYRAGESGPDHLFITYPEGGNGHQLITCLGCGEIYAVTVVKEMYIGPPLAEKIRGIQCINCGVNLDNNYLYYPDTYVVDGVKCYYQRDKEIPDDTTSLVKDFIGIYES